ncbi:MAG: hypothetical protein ACR2PS_09630 [Pseudomonadales bacterium]
MNNSQRNPQAKRAWVSLILAAIMLGLVLTGLLSYLLAYNSTLSGIHTWFGLAFVIAIVLHITNNGRTLVSYMKRQGAKIKLFTASGIAAGLVLGVMLYIPPFSSLIETGYNIRRVKGVEEGSYQTVFTRMDAIGQPLTIELRAGPHYESPPQPLFLGLSYRATPQVVFWIEDMQGRYIETLYVTEKISTSNFRSTDITDSELRRRPESLPYWSHKRGIVDTDGLMVPQHNNTDLDGVTAATPLGHYDISTVTEASRGQFRVLMEINRSYDFNTYYSKNRFPNDLIYSGSGASGQPSLIYAAKVNLNDSNTHYIMAPIGHGHHSGADGKLYPDLSQLDTALQLVERVIVGVPKGSAAGKKQTVGTSKATSIGLNASTADKKEV